MRRCGMSTSMRHQCASFSWTGTTIMSLLLSSWCFCVHLHALLNVASQQRRHAASQSARRLSILH